ncbi:hypothetical protein ACH4TS_12995 [Streptomyces albidoflavus]
MTARSGSGATFAPTCLTCERLAAFTDADDLAKGKAMPSDDEIAVSSTVTVTCSNEFTPPPTQVQEGRLAAVSRASLQSDLANALERNTRLAARVRQLEKRLSEQLGEQA